MAKINFYHLTKTPIGKALPKLLEKAVVSEMRVLVQAPSVDRMNQLNKELWTYTTKFFLPHGTAEDGFVEEQPIFLTASNDNANGATVYAFIEGAEPADFSVFDKCLYMFDGNDEQQLRVARERWKEYSDAGHEMIYWQQNVKGGWQQGG